MHTHDLSPWTHDHVYATGGEAAAERRTRLVVALTVAMMGLEIVVGTLTNSMALLADGFHMATHAAALGIAAFAYAHARRHAFDRRYSFGTGKVGALAAFTSAIILGVVALGMVWESASRFFSVQTIAFEQALIVATLGLVVNLLSVLILGGPGQAPHHDHGHDHGHGHGHDHGHGAHEDHNIRAAYLHVMADAVTSVLAIVALLFGKYMGWWWLDPLIGIVGAAVIGRWAWGLMMRSGAVLLDHSADKGLEDEVRMAIEGDGTAINRVADLHLWQVGPGHWAAIVSVVSDIVQPIAHYRALLAEVHELSHVTIEVQACAGCEGDCGCACGAATASAV
ncbi:CDF family Co(II)/Ni(II) efflux transporter DmeF [Rhodospirillum rubrum]|uniref:Cation efflux protein n=1 Tax=Rhodospirillum rubrum (strain ATCC 11170 / ATH 1.1.1 / DSM 467 / LMG 4362 / NCIMB 8255 / S1) TaxID=269796 RepID=Q2RTP7_RHORT|nr:CDF family Co(II)/Ni(II) efflux transporter DmeF [Rhodospirillum rubrum]ABC22498.1 Cation efflux protein [Rhodospirillum rubrum ATCC 11170]AEO48216.1 cation efflux protein [Rhodospirillum rubrum F11]MBK5954086.1 cation transporter [Rhodospirillum rubrum]QXG82128.1 CDF family Co(II)/Ni(II) efflux transporter DmeF [Rhodospirillum rubrum]HAQ00993.1 cation transporter [Rhodospirillum rubrum]